MKFEEIENLTKEQIFELYDDSFENYLSPNIRYFYVTCNGFSGTGGPAYNSASCSAYTQMVGYCDTAWYADESGNVCDRSLFQKKCVQNCTNR